MMLKQASYALHSMLFLLILTALLVTPVTQNDLNAASRPSLIRDTEIENTLKEWLTPLQESAGMKGHKVNLILINSDKLNAFVAGGSNIFFYSGLILKTRNPEELIGVMAHELGHISGGHLVSMGHALERASYESIIGMVLGIGAAILTGDARAAHAISAGASGLAQNRFLAHTRTNESAADQAAVTMLDKAEISPAGLNSFLKTLESEEFLPASKQSEYVRTHPLTSNRINALKRRTEQSPNTGKKLPEKWYEQHKRMKAKLVAFISPGKVPWIYSDRDTSVAARYARSIAAYRLNDIETALKEIDALLKQEPKNPYFLELKGQMLVEFGRVKEALPYYKKSLKNAPKADLIRTAYAHALLESRPDNTQLKEAIKNLQIAVKTETRNPQIHRLLATAHGKLGNNILTKLHLSEEALLQRRLPYAKKLATYVLENSKKSSGEWIRAQDILSYIEMLNKRQQK